MPHHPPIDPDLLDMLAAPDLDPPWLHASDIADRRRKIIADPDALRRNGAIVTIERSIVGTPDRRSIAVIELRPSAGANGAGIVYVHGGGMVFGTRHHVDASVLDAVESGFVVISVEYRLAPEHPYPAGIDDCFAALCWTSDHADELGIDPGRLAIAGSSAGGGLAAGTALLARDRGGPVLSHQVLFCPMLDDRGITPSSQELQGEGRWDSVANRTGWTALLGERRGAADVPAYAAPARATNLAGLPPTFIDVGDVETFRDEDIDYAVRLSRAGVGVELHLWPGGVHGFSGLAPDAAISRGCRETRRRYFDRMAGPAG